MLTNCLRASWVENLERRLLLVAPVNHVPGPQTMVEDTTLFFTSGNNNRITITDVDGPGPFEVELNSVNGTASIPNQPTVTITGNGTSGIRIIGTLANVNIAIANIAFRPANGFEGIAILQVESDDQNGTGGLTDTDNINITVTPNQSPVNFVPGTQTTGMNSPLRFSTTTGNPMSLTDVDGPGPFEVELNTADGIVTIANASGATLTNNGTSNVAIVGTIDQVRTAVSDFTFTPTTGFTGNTLVVLETDDLNGTGGRADTDFTTVRVVNGTPPRVGFSSFQFEQSHGFEFTFNQSIDEATLDATDIRVRSLPSRQIVPIFVDEITYFPAVARARFTLQVPLDDGNYEYVLLNNMVENNSGLTNGEYFQPFFVLAGDANRDRVVNFNDVLIVAQNYGLSNRTFSQGNFDYSANGLVDFNDLLIMAQNYGVALPALKSSPFGSRRIGEDVLMME